MKNIHQASDDARTARPLRVMFLITSMPVGGAETLLVNLVRRLDRKRFAPDICCLKEPGPLGEELADEMPVFSNLLSSRLDLRVWPRLKNLFRRREIDAVITVGAGDKMFWGRLAARRVGVPVIVSALHSTGWPDGVGRLNRMLTPITDAFVAVAKSHGDYLRDEEGFPAEKIHVIANGIDTDRFQPIDDLLGLRRELNLSIDAPTVGIVAALRPEKNHEMLLRAIKRVRDRLSDVQLLIVGDGPEREGLESLAKFLGLAETVQFLGNREDIPRVVAAVDVFALASHIEANPVSILEAMACGKPAVATDVGSVHEMVQDGQTGYLVPAGDVEAMANRLIDVLENPRSAQQMGVAARQSAVESGSVHQMVAGYENLLSSLYAQKTGRHLPNRHKNGPVDTPAGVCSAGPVR